MKIVSLVISLLLSVQLLGQYVYNNDVYSDQDWILNASSHIVTLEDGYVYCGAYLQPSNLGYFIREFNEYFDPPVALVEMNCDELFTQRSGAFTKVTEGLLQVGHKDGAAWALRIDDDGEVLWEVSNFDDESIAVEYNSGIETMAGDYVFSGNKAYDTDDDPWAEYSDLYVSKVNALGESIWERHISLTEDQFFEPNGLFELDNGELLISGAIYHNFDKVLIKLDANGEFIETYRWGSEEFGDWMPWLIQEENGQFIVAHHTGQSEYNDFFNYATINVMQFDANTMLPVWNIEFPEIEAGILIRDFIATPDGGYAITGVKSVEAIRPSFIMKLDENFNQEWRKDYAYDLALGGSQSFFDIDVSLDGGFICAGSFSGQNSNEHPQKSWILKLDACGDIEDLGCEFIDGVEELEDLPLFSIYPNPNSGSFTFTSSWSQSEVKKAEVTIRNTLGQTIYSEPLTSPTSQIEVPELPSGIYLLSLSSEGKVLYDEKLMVE